MNKPVGKLAGFFVDQARKFCSLARAAEASNRGGPCQTPITTAIVYAWRNEQPALLREGKLGDAEYRAYRRGDESMAGLKSASL